MGITRCLRFIVICLGINNTRENNGSYLLLEYKVKPTIFIGIKDLRGKEGSTIERQPKKTTYY